MLGGGTSTAVGGAAAATILPPLGRRPRRRGAELSPGGESLVLVIMIEGNLLFFKHFYVSGRQITLSAEGLVYLVRADELYLGGVGDAVAE